MKSKGTAYLLWFFLGLSGFHRFYCGKWVSGFIWLFTFGLLGIGWFIDLFLISEMVDLANADFMRQVGMLSWQAQNPHPQNQYQPTYFQTPRPAKTSSARTLVLILGFLALVAYVMRHETKRKDDTTASTASAFVMSAELLYSEYTADELVADEKYKGKLLQVSGTVESIEKWPSGEIYVKLHGPLATEGSTVRCGVLGSLRQEYKAESAKLSKGQQVVIQGKCDGIVLGLVRLMDCDFK